MQDHLADGMEDHPRLRDLRAGLRPVSGAEQPERRRHERSGDDPPRAPRLRLHRRADDAAERAAVRPRRAQAGEKVPVRVAGRDAPELRIHRSVRRDPRRPRSCSTVSTAGCWSASGSVSSSFPERRRAGPTSRPSFCAAASARPASARSCWRSTCSSSS